MSLVLVTSVSATILRVSHATPGTYNTITAAITAAAATDTITVAASPYTYDAFTVDKPLTIIGAGTDTTVGEATITGYINVNSEADGSVLEGLWVQGYQVYNSGGYYGTATLCIWTSASKIVVTNCFFELARYEYPENSAAVVMPNASVSFERCGFWTIWSYPYATEYGVLLSVGDSVNIQNCVFSNSHYSIAGGDAASSVLSVSHCVFQDNRNGVAIASDARGNIENSVCTNGRLISGTNASVSYCAQSDTVLPPGIGNIRLPEGSFVNLVYGNPRLSDFHLAAGSTLINAGNPGSTLDRDGSRADIGVYGGPSPYDPRGVPDFPFVLSLIVPPSVPQNSTLGITATGRVGQ